MGIGYVPENRLVQGLVLDHSVENNLVITVLDQIINGMGLIDFQKKRSVAEKAVQEFNIKTESMEAPVKNLSGGNQQKVVLAKWILTSPHLLILDTPTHGSRCVQLRKHLSVYSKIIPEKSQSDIYI